MHLEKRMNILYNLDLVFGCIFNFIKIGNLNNELIIMKIFGINR
jgi:hypothetical protein